MVYRWCSRPSTRQAVHRPRVDNKYTATCVDRHPRGSFLARGKQHQHCRYHHQPHHWCSRRPHISRNNRSVVVCFWHDQHSTLITARRRNTMPVVRPEIPFFESMPSDYWLVAAILWFYRIIRSDSFSFLMSLFDVARLRMRNSESFLQKKYYDLFLTTGAPQLWTWTLSSNFNSRTVSI